MCDSGREFRSPENAAGMKPKLADFSQSFPVLMKYQANPALEATEAQIHGPPNRTGRPEAKDQQC